jgi:DNA mismatch repair ATPase MutS
MAELERLKAIVDAARRAGSEGRALLYLVDELLQGTNSAERQIAARRIIRHLAERHALGAVTTHDLELGDTPELRARLVPVHFRETVHAAGDGAPLTFDYRLRPGVATSRNALKLMEIVGLGDA